MSGRRPRHSSTTRSSRRLLQVEDEYLVLMAQSGARWALEKLVAHWQPRLWRHARRLTGRPELAADALQEGWISIVARLPTLEDPARFGPWAYRIVTNKAADLVRREKALNAATERAAERSRPGDSLPEEATSEVGALRRAIERLPADRRALLALFYLEDLSVSEIAIALGIPAGTVKSRLHTLRNELKAMLERRESGRFRRSMLG